ncbi:MAG: hypothetical protein ABIC95_01210 [archaeon]
MPTSFVRMCPRCNSTDIGQDFSNPGLVGTGLFANAFRCKRCGYASSFFPEVEKNKIPKEKPIEELKKADLVNSDHGKRMDRWWRYAGFALVGAGIAFLMFPELYFLHYLSMLILLPVGILFVAFYRLPKLREHKAFRILITAAIIYGLTIGPVIVAWLTMSAG